MVLDKRIKEHLLRTLSGEGDSSEKERTAGSKTSETAGTKTSETSFLADVTEGLHRVFPGACRVAMAQLSIQNGGNLELKALRKVGEVDDSSGRTTAPATAASGAVGLHKMGLDAVAQVSSSRLLGLSAAEERAWRVFIDIESKPSSSSSSSLGLFRYFAGDRVFLLQILRVIDSKLDRLVAESAVAKSAYSLDVWMKRRLMAKATGIKVVDLQSPDLPPDVREMLRLREEGKGEPKGKRRGSFQPDPGSHKLSRSSCLALGLPLSSVGENDEVQQEVFVGVHSLPGSKNLFCIITALPESGVDLNATSLKASEVMSQVVRAASTGVEKSLVQGPGGKMTTRADPSEAVKEFFGHLLLAMQSKLAEISQVGP
jgi:hypothetical protein